jgi:hypothetical protein
MRRLGILFLLGILSLSPLALAGWGQPDLVVKEVRLSPVEPEPGDQVQIVAVIANEGRGNVAQSFDVRFKVDDLTISRRRVTQLRAGRTVEATAQWQAIDGEHRIAVEVDRPFGRVVESDERNNSLEITVTVRRKAAVYSTTDEIILTIGESLQTTGEMLHFTVGNDIFAAIDQGVEQLKKAQLILDEAGKKLVQIGESLPPPLSQDRVITGGRAVGEVFWRMADSLDAVASALQSFNVNVAVAALRELEAELNELSGLSFEWVWLGRLAEAAKYLEDATLAALALQENLFGSDSSSSSEGEGRTTDELVADFQTALGKAGDVIGAVGVQIKGLATSRGISFSSAEGQRLVEYHSGETLLIQVPGAIWLMLEVYDPVGSLVTWQRVFGEHLRWQGEDSSGALLPAGEYFYRLRAYRGAGEETDIGQLLIS